MHVRRIVQASGALPLDAVLPFDIVIPYRLENAIVLRTGIIL